MILDAINGSWSCDEKDNMLRSIWSRSLQTLKFIFECVSEESINARCLFVWTVADLKAQNWMRLVVDRVLRGLCGQ